MKNGVWIEMDRFNLVVMEEDVEEIAGRESKSSLEKGGQHHNLFGMRGEDFFILGRPPLNHDTVREKVFFYEFQ
jgi:hypothetical protein